MLTDRLRRQAIAGAALRELVLEKQAGVPGTLARAAFAPWPQLAHPLRTVGRVAKTVGKNAIMHPLMSLVGGAGTVAAVGKARTAMTGFNPAVHRAQLGMEP